jgi:hypothetical protein
MYDLKHKCYSIISLDDFIRVGINEIDYALFQSVSHEQLIIKEGIKNEIL